MLSDRGVAMEFWLIAYDIPNDKRRNKIADALEDYGRRVQYSVFEVWLDTADKRKLLRRLNELIVENEDSIRLYRLCADCQQRLQILGLGDTPQAPGVMIF